MLRVQGALSDEEGAAQAPPPPIHIPTVPGALGGSSGLAYGRTSGYAFSPERDPAGEQLR